MGEKMSTRQLHVNEFIGPLANQSSTYIEEYEKFREFNDEVTGQKLRRDKKNAPDEGDAPPKKKWLAMSLNSEPFKALFTKSSWNFQLLQLRSIKYIKE